MVTKISRMDFKLGMGLPLLQIYSAYYLVLFVFEANTGLECADRDGTELIADHMLRRANCGLH